MRAIFVLLLAALTACASPTTNPSDPDVLLNGDAVDGVRLSVAASSYRHGESAVLHLVNNSDAEIGYNACSAARELWTGDLWVRIEPLRMCTAALYPLDTGEQTTFEELVTSEWTPGRYRVVLRIYRPDRDDNFVLATNLFDVTQ